MAFGWIRTSIVAKSLLSSFSGSGIPYSFRSSVISNACRGYSVKETGFAKVGLRHEQSVKLQHRFSSLSSSGDSGDSTDCNDIITPIEYLHNLGYTDPLVVAGMLNVIPGADKAGKSDTDPAQVRAVIRKLQQFGESGLKSLANAVQREMDEEQQMAHLPDVTIHIRSPHSGRYAAPLEITGKQGQTLYDLHQKGSAATAGGAGESDTTAAARGKAGGGAASLPLLMECACGGIAACSTCHIIFEPDDYSAINEIQEPDEAELDMLDLAEDVTPTSRLGCQVKLHPCMQDMVIQLPTEVRNLFDDIPKYEK